MRAIESYPEDLTVVVAGTGGISHQVHGERAGFNNEAWDRELLEQFVRAPEKLVEMTHAGRDPCVARKLISRDIDSDGCGVI